MVSTQNNTAESESCPTEQPVETTTKQQRKIERLCEVADQGMYRRTHQPSLRGRPVSTPNVYPVHLGVENRYRDDEYQRYNHNDRGYLFNRYTECPVGRRHSTATHHDRYHITGTSLVIEALETFNRTLSNSSIKCN